MKLLNVLMLAVVLPLAPVFASDHPCKDFHESLETQCKTAGFTRGKGLYTKCLGVIKKGGTVAGVTPDVTLKAACEAKKEKKAAKAEVKKSS